MSHTDKNLLQQMFNSEFDKIVDWLHNNRLVLNLKKTNFMIFSKKHIDYDAFAIKIKDYSIQRTSHVKFLGVTLDDKLSWNEHTGVICNRLSKNIGVLNKLKSCSKEVLMMLYNTLILPHLCSVFKYGPIPVIKTCVGYWNYKRELLE